MAEGVEETAETGVAAVAEAVVGMEGPVDAGWEAAASCK